MRKRFNTTGVCIPAKHYMVDISAKLDAILPMVADGDYFVINRPRQYGKTTTLFLLEQRLRQDAAYLPILISFEGISAAAYQDEQRFLEAWFAECSRIFSMLEEKILPR